MTSVTPTPIAGSEDVSGLGAKLKAFMPDLSKFYLEPIDPSSDIAPADRVSLVWRSARPWGEFFDFSNFNLPALDHWSERVSTNVQTFFYNYFLLTLVHLLLFAVGHLGPVVVLVLYAALAYFLFVANEEDIPVGDAFVVDRKVKIAIVAVVGLLALFYGGVINLVLSLLIFLVIFVGIHSSIRENPELAESLAPTQTV